MEKDVVLEKIKRLEQSRLRCYKMAELASSSDEAGKYSRRAARIGDAIERAMSKYHISYEEYENIEKKIVSENENYDEERM